MPVVFLLNEPLIQNLTFTLNDDEVALEENETFSISFTGAILPMNTEVIDRLDVIIVDINGENKGILFRSIYKLASMLLYEKLSSLNDKARPMKFPVSHSPKPKKGDEGERNCGGP